MPPPSGARHFPPSRNSRRGHELHTELTVGTIGAEGDRLVIGTGGAARTMQHGAFEEPVFGDNDGEGGQIVERVADRDLLGGAEGLFNDGLELLRAGRLLGESGGGEQCSEADGGDDAREVRPRETRPREARPNEVHTVSPFWPAFPARKYRVDSMQGQERAQVAVLSCGWRGTGGGGAVSRIPNHERH